jgi:tight adherence protein C
MHRGENKIQKRLRSISNTLVWESEPVEKALGGGPLPFYLRPLKLLSNLFPGQSSNEALRWELAGAGFRHFDAPAVYTGLRMLLLGVFAVGMFLVATRFQLAKTEMMLLVAVGGALGGILPRVLLSQARTRRRREITLSLPDALDLLVICVEAGQGLNAALMSVARETSAHSPALADELKILNLEMSTGVARAEALHNLALRSGTEDVQALVAVLVQSDKFGTSVGQALRNHAASLRIRRRQRAEEAARKTPVKMVFPLVFCIFPALLVVILAPGIIDLVRALQDVNQ